MRNLQDIRLKASQGKLLGQDRNKGKPVKEKKIEFYLYGMN